MVVLSEKLKRFLFNIVLHPIALAIPVAFLAIWLIPDYFEKYILTLDYENIHETGVTFEYHDLDHDGNSEWFVASNTNQNTSGIAIHNHLGIIFHWHFDGYFIPNQQKCMVGDADNNGIDEIYVFTMKGDSLLMHCVDYRKFPDPILKNIFIATIPGENPKYNFMLILGKITDLDGDGFKEIVFAVNTGYGGTPRKVFAYNIKKKQLLSSIELGVSLSDLQFADFDNDKLDEMLVTNYGPGNVRDSTQKMQDTCGYLIALDNTLGFLFPPIVNQGLYNGVGSISFKNRDRNLIASIFGIANQKEGFPSLKIYNGKGELLKQKQLERDFQNTTVTVQAIENSKTDDNLLFIKAPGSISLLDRELKTKAISDQRIGFSGLYQNDLDGDGSKELIFQTTTPGRWAILRNNLRNPVYLKTDFSNKMPLIFSILQTGKNPKFSFQLGGRQSVFEYAFNTMYYWQYPIYFGIYLFILLFILLISKLQRIQQKRKIQTQQIIGSLQLLSIRNQLDPHFTFNALNTIGSVMNQGRTLEAYSLLLNFSKILRTILSSSDSVCRTLGEELDFVQNYIEIQQGRFKDRIGYSVFVHPEIDKETIIPKSCIQNYVENAVKHGISPKPNGGEINILVEKHMDYLNITITDNGIGREKAAKNTGTSTGRGNSIMRQYYQLLNKSNNNPIIEKVIDLYDENGEPNGWGVNYLYYY